MVIEIGVTDVIVLKKEGYFLLMSEKGCIFVAKLCCGYGKAKSKHQ